MGRQHSGRRSQGQATIHGDSHYQHVDDVVAHTSPVVDADEIPEGRGSPGLLDEHPGPYLGGFVSWRSLNRLVSEIAKGTQTDVGRSVVEEFDQQQQQRSPGYARKPEEPLYSQLAEGRANQKQECNYANSLERPDYPHGGAQVSPEPQGDPGHRQYGENGGGDAQDHAEVEVELPKVAHDAGEQHSDYEQNGSG